MRNCLINKRFLYILLLIFIVGFLILPEICSAEDFENIKLEELSKYLELPEKDANRLMNTLRQVFTTEGIFSWSSGDVTNEKTAVAVTLLKVVGMEALSHLLVDVPIEITWGIVKGAVEISRIFLDSYGVSVVLNKIEKETVKRAIAYGMDFLVGNELRVTPGAIKFKYFSYKGGEKEIVLQYVMIYKTESEKRARAAIRFYMPNSIEAPDAEKYNKGMTSLPVPDLRKDLPPFIVEVSGRVEKDEKLGNYWWIDEKGRRVTEGPEPMLIHPSVKIDFPPTVPDLGIKPLSAWEKYVLKPIETTIKEVEIIITKVTGKSLGLVEIWEEVKKFILKITNLAPAAIVETPLSSSGDSVVTVEAQSSQLEIESKTKTEAVEVKPQQSQEPKPLTLEELQEILDDIAEQIDILSQKTAKLATASQLASKNNPKVEELKETEKPEEINEEVGEKEVGQGAEQELCQKIAGVRPLQNKIIINEVAWMGTVESYTDEWIELKNISGAEINLAGWQIINKEKKIKITFTQHRVLSNGFWLLERTNDETVPGVTADLIYTGAIKNSDEALYLFDGNCQLQDEVLANPAWPAGDNSSKRTMERRQDLSWQTSANPGGTPKRENSSGYVEIISGGGGSSGGSTPLQDTEPPIANAGFDQTVIINQAVTFDGSQSSDNVKIVSFQWDIDNKDGLNWNSPDLTGEKPTFTQGYSQLGIYTVTLRVSDKAGNSATDTLIITVIQPPKILISEIQIDTTISSSYDFVELYNPNNFDIDISGFQLKKKASTGSETSIRVFPTGNKILAQSYFLWANSNYALSGLISADATSTQTLAKNNSLALFDKNRNLIDAVAWGSSTNPFVEGSPFPQNPEKDQSLGRKWIEGEGYQDTDNNSVDFEIQIPTPKAKNETFRDIIPPETTILNKPSSLTNQTQAVFTFSSSEENSTFECKIDEENWQICFSPQQYSNLLDGLHAFQVRAKDISQNTDPIPAQYQWKIDTIPPRTEILTFPPSLTNQIQATFTFSSNEKNCSFECKLNEDGWGTCQSPAIYENLTDGTYTFSVRAKDKAQNLDTEPPKHVWEIDTTIESPILSLFDLDTNSSFYTNQREVGVIIFVSGSEEGLNWFLSEDAELSENPVWLSDKPENFTLSEGDGPKTVYIWTKDGLGNISQLGNSDSIILDTTVPEITLDTKPADPTNQTEAAFTFSSNEENSIFECQIDEGNWQGNCLSSITFSALIEGLHTLQVKAADLAGNVSEPYTYSWTIDLTPPEVSFIEISSPQTQTSFLISWTGEGKFQFRYSDDEINWIYFPSENEYTSETEYEFSGEDEASYYFQIRAKDEAGNESEWQEKVIKISLPKPLLEVDKDLLEFEGIEYGSDPESQTLAVCNFGQANLEWEIATFPEVSWLIINSISGQIPPDDCLEISVSVNISDLCSGQYLTKISISSDGGSKEIETVLKLEEDNVPPADANLVLADLTNESNFYTNNRIVKAAITNDQDASFWLLSETQVKPETDSLDWQTAKPSAFTLSEGDGSKTVYIWTKDKAENISELGKYASIVLDTTPPIANAGEDRIVEINQPITFDASGSSDNTEITSFKWDTDDTDGLNWEEPNLVGETPVFTGYSEIENYRVTLQVSDVVGHISVDTFLVSVILPQPTLEVVINEIAWMGTKASDNDEWIELYNNTTSTVDLTGWRLVSSDESPNINFSSLSIPPNGYFLLERTANTTVKDVSADLIYTGALRNNPNCEVLSLYDQNNKLIDQTTCVNGNWPAGKNEKDENNEWLRITMERINPLLAGSNPANWANNNLITRNGKDAAGNKINGTPKAKNSVSTSPTTISSLPFDEFSKITLTYLGSPYIVKWELAISQGKTLTIEPGVVIKFYDGYSGMAVQGTLKAIGGETDDKKIIFTSYNPNPQPGNWKQIYFSSTSTDSELVNTIIKYGGNIPSSDAPCPWQMAAIRVEQSSITLKSSIIEENKAKGVYLMNSPSTTIDNVQFFDNPFCQGTFGQYGGIALLIDGGSPTVKNSTFKGNTTGIEIRNSASPIIENNIFEENKKPIYVYNSYPAFSNNQAINNNLNGILVYGGNINQDAFWQADLPYIIDGTLNISQNITFTLEPGVVIKFYNSASGITVQGTLKAIGAEDKKIIFTSYKDDEFGGSGSAVAGDWKQIYFTETSTESELDNVIIRYGGNYYLSDADCPWQRAAIRVEKAEVLFKNSTIESNKSKGLYLIDCPSATTIDNVKFLNHQVGCKTWQTTYQAVALLVQGGSPTIKNSTFKNNYYGIYIQSGQPTLENLTFGENDEKNNIDIYPAP